MNRIAQFVFVLLVAAQPIACSDAPGERSVDRADAGASAAPTDADPFAGAPSFELSLPAQGRAYVALGEPSVVSPSGDPMTSSAWDLAFEGSAIYTNSGPSGHGKGGAFGRVELSAFREGKTEVPPFVWADKTGGAFLDWSAYEQSTHLLYSRFHVYGVRDGERLWKVQILSYYGEQNGAPQSGIYRLRYAELSSQEGSGQAHEVQVDGTAGGMSASSEPTFGCLDLATGNTAMFTLAEAQGSKAWHLCFHRDAISVNGEVGGPRGVGAVDLQAEGTSSEQLAEVKTRTEGTERALFDGVSAASFANAAFRGDHVVSAFETEAWLEGQPGAQAPAAAAWLVVDAGGTRKYFVGFSSFKAPTTTLAGAVMVHVKPALE